MIDHSFKDQLELGVIERIPNFEDFLKENPNCSFLGHMPVFKLGSETTKVRVVYLSNLCDGIRGSLSHNQTICSGPNLNRKLSIAIMQLKFNKYLLCYDLVKAFLQIAIPEIDQNRLFLMV